MCRSILTSIALCGLLPAGCQNESAQRPKGPPRIHFEQSELDLGTVPISAEGQRAEFRFVNRGLSDLRITRLVNSCSCAGSDVSQTVVPPAEHGTVVVAVHPRKAEERTASVTVHSNDPLHPQRTLRVTWRAVAPLQFDPLSVDFGTLLPEKTAEQTVHLVRHRLEGMDSEATIDRIERFPQDSLQVAWQRTEDAQTHSLQLKLATGGESGSYNGRVVMHLKNAWRPSVTLPVHWKVQDIIEATPSAVFLKSGPPGTMCSKNVLVSAHPHETLQIQGVGFDTKLPESGVTWKRVSENRILIELACTLPDNPGTREAVLLIHCTQPEQRVLRVRVSAYVLGPQVAESEEAKP